MLIASAFVTRLARQLAGAGTTPGIALCLALLLVLVAAVAAADFLAPAPEPIVVTPLRW